MTCPNCNYALSAFDKDCPRCHPSSKTSRQPNANTAMQNWKDNPAVFAWLVAGALAVALLMSLSRGSESPPSSAPVAAPAAPGQIAAAPQVIQPTVRLGPTFNQVDSKLDDRISTWTEAQKQAYWESVSGTQITWSGQVTQVEISSGGTLTLKCNPQTWSSDVFVTLDGSQIASLPTINKNQFVTVTGILDNHSSSGYSISQGHISGL